MESNNADYSTQDFSTTTIEPYTVDPAPAEETTYYEEFSTDDDAEYQNERKFPLPLLVLGGLVILGIIILLFFLLSGGKSNTNQNNNNNTGNTNNNTPITLEWWGVFMDPEVIQPLIEEYQDENPNVTIKYEDKWFYDKDFKTASEDYLAELNRVILSGVQNGDIVEIPDIFMIENTWALDYEKYTAPAPTALISAESLRSSYYPAVANDFIGTSGVHGLPLWIDTLAIIYNKDLIAQNNNNILTPPENWIEFRNFAESLTKREGRNLLQAGFAAGAPGNTSFTFELLNLLFVQNGVSLYNPTTGQPEFATNTQAQGAVNFYKSFVSSNQTWSSGFKNDAAAFLEKDVAMIVGTSWRLRDLLNYNESYNLGINIGVSPMPQIQGQSQPFLNWATYWGNMVSNQRPNSQAAWQFLNWLSQPEQLRKLHENIKTQEGHFGTLYPRSDMADDLATDQYLNVYNEGLSTALSLKFIKGLQARKAFEEMASVESASDTQLRSLETALKGFIEQKGIL